MPCEGMRVVYATQMENGKIKWITEELRKNPKSILKVRTEEEKKRYPEDIKKQIKVLS